MIPLSRALIPIAALALALLALTQCELLVRLDRGEVDGGTSEGCAICTNLTGGGDDAEEGGDDETADAGADETGVETSDGGADTGTDVVDGGSASDADSGD